MRSASFLRLAVVVALLALPGCVTMTVPERFLVLDRSGDELKAVTPEDSRLWVRDFSDDKQGGLAFWRDALRADFRENRGYVIVSERDVNDGAGTPGHEMVLETTLQGRPVRELLALFVYKGAFDDRIRVVEYVADKAAFDAEVEGVRSSLATLQP